MRKNPPKVEYPQEKKDYKYKKIIYKESFKRSRKLLQKFINKQSADKNIYHDLMQIKVKEILLVSTLYDAYILENEGGFFEQSMGEVLHLSLSHLPRITGVTSPDEALALLHKRNFDLVVIMSESDLEMPVKLSEKIKAYHPELQVFQLCHSIKCIQQYKTLSNKPDTIDRVFVWNGDSKIFFSMVKIVEDKLNVGNDTKIGLVRVILLIEDSPQFYSRLLSSVYSIVFEQTQQLIAEVNTNEIDKISRMRARTKVLLATDYEEAIECIEKYKEYLTCIISDIKFSRNDIVDPKAGMTLLKYVKKHMPDLPIVLQSSDIENAQPANDIGASFFHKHSESFLYDLKNFIIYNLGFKHFVYRDKDGKPIAIAKSIYEFEKQLRTISAESILYHALKNHFSLWLMARGEIQIAKVVNPVKASDFKSPEELRRYLIEVIQNFRMDKYRGKVVNFDGMAIRDEKNIVSFGTGSLGGKGRGLAFINMLINNMDFSEYIEDIEIKTPLTSIIGTDEFEFFLEKNDLHEFLRNEPDYQAIKERFIKAELSKELNKKLKVLAKLIKRPLAIRSSSLFEDSITQPFAGIFDTYIIPNDHKELNFRIKQISDAVKLVYASIYSDNAKSYFNAINYKVEEEKMAVIIQELVGQKHNNYYYPDISGTAQSYNFYPFGHMKQEDGFAMAALGLGQYVVEGEKSYRFSPKYPKIEINTTENLLKNSQVEFLALEMERNEIDLLQGEDAALKRLEISEAENHGVLRHLVSVYDIENDRLESGLSKYGPRILNFANILKYDYIPFAKTLSVILNVVNEALGTPVEIEYAVDLKKNKNNKATFYLLQIKPMVGNEQDYHIGNEEIEEENVFLYSEKSMGNGKIDNITDLIYVDPKKFNKLKTENIVKEIEALNTKLQAEGRNYVLIGPGRWGTRDKFIGIPVKWPQISNAKVIVETSLKDFPLDASLGSHFFHNVTSMQVGYFSILSESRDEFIKWDILHQQQIIEECKYVKHIRFDKNLTVKMDGRKGISIISL